MSKPVQIGALVAVIVLAVAALGFVLSRSGLGGPTVDSGKPPADFYSRDRKVAPGPLHEPR